MKEDRLAHGSVVSRSSAHPQIRAKADSAFAEALNRRIRAESLNAHWSLKHVPDDC